MQELPFETAKKAVRGLNYISHPLRLRILEYLDVNGESSVSEITDAVREEQAIVSQSLRKLREADLVKTHRHGLFIYYQIQEEYPASIFKCIRKLYGYHTDNFYFLQDDYKALLPHDYTKIVASQIKLFANYDKFRILEYLLLHGESNVSNIIEGTTLPQMKVSQYLGRLRHEGFVSARREGRFIFYILTSGVHKTAIQCIHRRYDSLQNKKDF